MKVCWFMGQNRIFAGQIRNIVGHFLSFRGTKTEYRGTKSELISICGTDSDYRRDRFGISDERYSEFVP